MRPAPAAHSPEIEQQAREIVAELAPHHPTPGNIALARSVIASLIAVNGDIRAKLRASHEAWRVVWASYREGRFKPQLWRWVADDDWTEPPDTEEVRKLCKSNEAKRKSQERDEQIRIAVEKQERLKAEEAAEAARKEKEWWAKYNAACEAKKAAKAAEVAKEQSDAT